MLAFVHCRPSLEHITLIFTGYQPPGYYLFSLVVVPLKVPLYAFARNVHSHTLRANLLISSKIRKTQIMLNCSVAYMLVMH